MSQRKKHPNKHPEKMDSISLPMADAVQKYPDRGPEVAVRIDRQLTILVPASLTAKQRAERIERFLHRLDMCRAKRFKDID